MSLAEQEYVILSEKTILP